MSFAISGLEYKQKVAAGKIKSMESKVMAQQEDLAAVARERDRKSRLADAMASQNAAAGAGGVRAFEGSPLAILREDIDREQTASGRDAFQSEMARMTTLTRGKIAKKQARTSANIGLLRDISDMAEKSVSGGGAG